jgi:hypothetical protein
MNPPENATNGTFKFINSTIKTKRTCGNDIDDQYIAALKSADGFQKFDRGISLTKGGQKMLEALGPIQRKKPNPVPSFIPNIPQSMYRMKLLDSNVTMVMALVGNQGIGIVGCKLWSVLAQVGTNNTFKSSAINNISSSSSIPCITDNDQQYLDAIKQTDGYTVANHNFNLTQKGKPTIEFRNGFGDGEGKGREGNKDGSGKSKSKN